MNLFDMMGWFGELSQPE